MLCKKEKNVNTEQITVIAHAVKLFMKIDLWCIKSLKTC